MSVSGNLPFLLLSFLAVIRTALFYLVPPLWFSVSPQTWGNRAKGPHSLTWGPEQQGQRSMHWSLWHNKPQQTISFSGILLKWQKAGDRIYDTALYSKHKGLGYLKTSGFIKEPLGWRKTQLQMGPAQEPLSIHQCRLKENLIPFVHNLELMSH